MSIGRFILRLAALAASTLALRSAEPGADKAPGAAAAAPAAAAATTQPPLTPRFKQVRERIDTLFAHRNGAPPALEQRANPFRPPGSAPIPAPAAVPGDVALPPLPEPAEASSDLTRLQESVATLKVGGTLEREGKLYLLINGKQYKDNDVIPIQLRGDQILLRVREISRRGMTVSLEGAEKVEMSLKF